MTVLCGGWWNWDPSHLVVGTLATKAGGEEHLPQVGNRADGVT